MGVLIIPIIIFVMILIFACIDLSVEGTDSFVFKIYRWLDTLHELKQVPKCEHEFGKCEDVRNDRYTNATTTLGYAKSYS